MRQTVVKYIQKNSFIQSISTVQSSQRYINFISQFMKTDKDLRRLCISSFSQCHWKLLWRTFLWFKIFHTTFHHKVYDSWSSRRAFLTYFVNNNLIYKPHLKKKKAGIYLLIFFPLNFVFNYTSLATPSHSSGTEEPIPIYTQLWKMSVYVFSWFCFLAIWHPFRKLLKYDVYQVAACRHLIFKFPNLT